MSDEQEGVPLLVISISALKQLGVVAERKEVAVFVLRHRIIANHDGSVYSTGCSAANAVY